MNIIKLRWDRLNVLLCLGFLACCYMLAQEVWQLNMHKHILSNYFKPLEVVIRDVCLVLIFFWGLISKISKRANRFWYLIVSFSLGFLICPSLDFFLFGQSYMGSPLSYLFITQIIGYLLIKELIKEEALANCNVVNYKHKLVVIGALLIVASVALNIIADFLYQCFF